MRRSKRLDCSIKAEHNIDLNAGRNVLGARTIDAYNMALVKRIKAARRSKAEASDRDDVEGS